MMTQIKKFLNTLWMLLIKGLQILRNTLKMLYPEKTFTSKLCFTMALLCTLIFAINAISTVVTTAMVLVEHTGEKASNEITMVKFLCNQEKERNASITGTQLYNVLHKYDIDDDFKICLTDTAMQIQSCSDKSWVGDYINPSDNTFFSLDDEKLSCVEFRGNLYQLTVEEIKGTGCNIVLMKPIVDVMLPIGEVAMTVAQSSFYCILLLIICYLIMLYLLRRSSSKNTQIESEMAVAANVQNLMIPRDFSCFPESHGYDLHGLLQPAKVMGGDLFDFVQKGDKLCFCLGDVSGKGMPAALFMSEVHILFRHVLKYDMDPAAIAYAMNNSLAQQNDSNMFCTTFIGILDMQTNILFYCNAGHNPGIVIDPDGSSRFLEVKPNLALGLFEDFPYEKQQMEFLPGMSLFCYTDGVTEAESLRKKLFSDDSVLQALNGNSHLAPAEICKMLLSRVEEHTKMTEQSDDITMLCVKRS